MKHLYFVFLFMLFGGVLSANGILADDFLQCVNKCCEDVGGSYDPESGACNNAQGDWSGCPESCLSGELSALETAQKEAPLPYGKDTPGAICCGAGFILLGVMGFAAKHGSI